MIKNIFLFSLRLCVFALIIFLLSGCALFGSNGKDDTPDSDGWPYLDWRTNYMDVL